MSLDLCIEYLQSVFLSSISLSRIKSISFFDFLIKHYHYGRHQEFIDRNGMSVPQMTTDMFKMALPLFRVLFIECELSSGLQLHEQHDGYQ